MAIAQSSSNAFIFVDSDIEMKPGGLSLIRKAFVEDCAVSALTGIISLDHPHSNFFSLYKNTYMNSVFSEQPRVVNFLYGGICAIRKEDFISWPHIDLLGEDTQLGLNLTSQGKKIILLQDLEVIHHKHYSFMSIIRNDFLIPFGFAKSFLFFLKQMSLGKFKNQSSQFSHVSVKQVLCLILSSTGLLLLLLGPKGSHLLVGLFFMSSILGNSSLLLRLLKVHGFFFALRGVIWTLIDQVIMTCGAFFGLIYHGKIMLSKKSKEESLEHY